MRRSLKRKRQTGRAAGLSPAAAQLLARAGEAMRQRQVEMAGRMLDRVVEMAPKSAEAWRMRGLLKHMKMQHGDAVHCLRRAVDLDGTDAGNHMALGIALHDHGDTVAALAAFRQACALAPDSASGWFNLGKSLKLRAHDTDEARAALERALALDAAHIPARLTLADVCVSLGEVGMAIGHYRKILQQQPHQHRAWLGLANIRSEPFSDGEMMQLRTAHDRAEPASEAGIMLGFALSRALELRGEFAASFEVLQTANSAQRRHSRWNRRSEQARLTAIHEAFPQASTATTNPQQGSETIFIVSLPRAGSTLVEQILASHSEVEGAGEILDLQQVIDGESSRRGQQFPQWVGVADNADWSRLGEAYLAQTAHWRQDKPRSTDKNLINWQFVGAALAMLPGARFINVRRDPLETCLACYRQLFRTGNGFSYDLADLVHWWQQYDRLCRQWQSLYPGRFVDFQYESLLAQPEQAIRQLLDACQLPFEPGCLDFHRTRRVVRTASAAQVREPLRADTARARRYGETLAPLRDLLASADKRRMS